MHEHMQFLTLNHGTQYSMEDYMWVWSNRRCERHAHAHIRDSQLHESWFREVNRGSLQLSGSMLYPLYEGLCGRLHLRGRGGVT